MMTSKTQAKLRRVCAATLVLAVLGAAGPGQTQALEPAAAIAARKDGYREIGTAFKSLNDELRKPKPIPVTVRFNASTLSKTSKRMSNWFPAGSGPSSGIKTAAKAEIWTQRAAFDAIERKLLADTAQLDKLVAAGDMKAVAAQARVIGASCKACHDKFRTPES
jgi:cytochrome c556